MRYTTDRDSELYHYGVKGMKWGVHRSRTDTSQTSSKKSSGVKTKKRKGLSKGQKEFLKSLGIGVATVGITGAAMYGLNKAQQKAADEQRKKWRDAESRHREQQKQYRSQQDQNRSNQDQYRSHQQWRDAESRHREQQKQYRSHQNTAQTKSQDRAKKYQGQNIDYESARKRAASLRDKVAKAQRDGTLTPQMVDELQEAMAQVKAARSQMQHGIWYINNRDRVLMHSGMRGVVWKVRRTKY